MVIDIGGGTTEIAVIALSGIVSDTSIRVGGDEFDEAILQFLRKTYNILIGEPTAELVKMTIGSAYPSERGEEVMEVKGRDIVSGIPKTVKVGSAEVRESIRAIFAAVVTRAHGAERTPPELASDIETAACHDRWGGVLKGHDGGSSATCPPI